MAEYRNYNIFALQGDTETSDMDVCSSLDLDPDLAGKPEINEAAINKMHKENYDGFLKRGIPSEDALRMSDDYASKARSNVKKLLRA